MKKSKVKHKSSDQQDELSQHSDDNLNTDNSPKQIPISKLTHRPITKKIIINISHTQYPIIEQIAYQFGWLVQRNQTYGDWDIWWTDRQIQSSTLYRMHLHQKINHYPGICNLARKNILGLNLQLMQNKFPQQYNFFPNTWVIPLQFSQFRLYYQNQLSNSNITYIVKPQALSQGKGIFLTKNIEDILNGNKYVLQKYLNQPFLMDKLKFDLRIYVLLAGTQPLRLYLYHEGLVRFATEQYHPPNSNNLHISYMHLTNYSLNKNNPKYQFNTKDMNIGHKRILTGLYNKLQQMGHNVNKLKSDIQSIIIKTVICSLPNISEQYRFCQPEQYEGNMCFHLLGFDVMLTSELKPIIIEVNHTPSFDTSTPIDYYVKKNLITDTLKILRISQKKKKHLYQRGNQIAKIRLQTGKRDIYKGQDRFLLVQKAQRQRSQAEKKNMGGFKCIYPLEEGEGDNQKLMKQYEQFYEYAAKVSKQNDDSRKKILAKPHKQVKDGGKRIVRKQSYKNIDGQNSIVNDNGNRMKALSVEQQRPTTTTPIKDCNRKGKLQKIQKIKHLQQVEEQLSSAKKSMQKVEKSNAIEMKLLQKNIIDNHNKFKNIFNSESSIDRFMVVKFIKKHSEQQKYQQQSQQQQYQQQQQQQQSDKVILSDSPKIRKIQNHFDSISPSNQKKSELKGSFLKPKTYCINKKNALNDKKIILSIAQKKQKVYFESWHNNHNNVNVNNVYHYSLRKNMIPGLLNNLPLVSKNYCSKILKPTIRYTQMNKANNNQLKKI